MKPEGNILDKINRRDGLTVPEGYFDDFATRMAAQLPDKPAAAAPPRRSNTWRRVRPYVYMAAMFAGVWCMLHMFGLISQSGANSLTIDGNPTLASAAADEQFIEDYVIDDVSVGDLYDEMMTDSVDFYNLMDSVYNATLATPADDGAGAMPQ